MLIFAEGDPGTRMDDQWLHADFHSQSSGTSCPGGQASLTISVSGVTTAQLNLVEDGSLVRGFELNQVTLYSDAAGDTWLAAEDDPYAAWYRRVVTLPPAQMLTEMHGEGASASDMSAEAMIWSQVIVTVHVERGRAIVLPATSTSREVSTVA